MLRMFEKIGTIGETLNLRVSARGEGLYLYLPKSICEVHGLLTGDRIKAKLTEHYRQQRDIHVEEDEDHTVPPDCAKDKMRERR